MNKQEVHNRLIEIKEDIEVLLLEIASEQKDPSGAIQGALLEIRHKVSSLSFATEELTISGVVSNELVKPTLFEFAKEYLLADDLSYSPVSQEKQEEIAKLISPINP